MVFPRRIRAVVFDMDGVLIDSEVVFRDALIAVSAERGHAMPASLHHRLIGAPYASNIETLLTHYGAGFDAEGLFAAANTHFHQIVDPRALLKAGAMELLDHLDQLGLPRAIATSSSHDSVDSHLGPSGLIARFDAIVARGDYAKGKPAPDPFLTAARRLGVDAIDCLALEDSHNGVRSAHAAGMMTIMVPDLLEPNEEMRAKCVHIVQSLHEVRRLIEGAAKPR
jgi:HAD superfamily hydrolase (TIGR01509 family)